jgi:hypothetical protein
MFRLPVSGLGVTVRGPAGAEDVLLLEAEAPDTALALALVARLARVVEREACDWGALAVTDLDTLLLLIRSAAFGDNVRAEARCPGAGCGALIDLSFRISDYLAHDPPKMPRNVEPADEPGRYRLRGTTVTFRLPAAADQVAVMGRSHPERELLRRCVDPAEIPAGLGVRIEAAMASLAPPLSGELESTCPQCGRTVSLYFDPQAFTLRELCEQAAFIYQDVHLLAWHYHWSEDAILALPRERRAQYVEMVRGERG